MIDDTHECIRFGVWISLLDTGIAEDGTQECWSWILVLSLPAGEALCTGSTCSLWLQRSHRFRPGHWNDDRSSLHFHIKRSQKQLPGRLTNFMHKLEGTKHQYATAAQASPPPMNFCPFTLTHSMHPEATKPKAPPAAATYYEKKTRQHS